MIIEDWHVAAVDSPVQLAVWRLSVFNRDRQSRLYGRLAGN
jgi:hypothetical protein